MNWFQQIFSEVGSASFGRVGSFIALLFACGWISYVVYTTRVIPPLTDVALFIGTLYGLSKAGSVIAAVSTGTKPPEDGKV
jgi:hypothetical protein